MALRNPDEVFEALSHNGGGDWLNDDEMWVPPKQRRPLDKELGAFAGAASGQPEAAADVAPVEGAQPEPAELLASS